MPCVRSHHVAAFVRLRRRTAQRLRHDTAISSCAAEGRTRGNLALVDGTAPAGWRQTRWLAGAWLSEALGDAVTTPEAALADRRRLAWRMSIVGLALTIGPLGVLGPLWRGGQGGGEARAAGRAWAGIDSGDWYGEHLPLGAYGRAPVLRLDAPLPGTIELSALNGTNGFRSNGISTSDRSGRVVSSAGDVNNDGFDDILIGAAYADPNGNFSGQTYVVYGGPGVPSTVQLSALNGTNGFRLNGISSSDYSGYAVSGAGDVNNDGFDDILIGALGADPNGGVSGQSYVVYGGSALPSTVQLSALNGTNGFRLNGVSSTNRSGTAVSGAGDVNNDGFDDILIGADFASPNGLYSGQSYVVYGRTGIPATVQLSALNGSNGFRVNGILPTDVSGRAVAGAGDVNNDGFDDILIGAELADPNGDASGQSYVVYGGSAVPSTVQLSALNGTNGFRVNGISTSDFSGYTLSGAGDVNNDGFDDILIGAALADPNGSYSGQSYVVYGGPAVPATVQLSALNGTNGFRLNGISANDQAGRSVSGAGDVNMDGFDDILIGGPFASPNASQSGQNYVVYGGTGLLSTFELSALNGSNGFRVNGISASDHAGRWVSRAGDVNNDGFADIIIGARQADPSGSYSGQSYVVYGGVPSVPTATPTGTSSPTPTPTATPTDTPSPTPTDTPTATPTSTPTDTPTSTPTSTPTPSPLTVSITDPLGCTDNGDTLNVQVVANSSAAVVNATVQSTLPSGLTGLAGTCTFAGGSGTPTCVVSVGGMTWTGDIPAFSTLTINYQVRVSAGVAPGTQLCVVTEFDAGDSGTESTTACTAVDCPVSPTSVDLRSFRAIGLADRALVVWETATEADTVGFNVYRAASVDGPWTQVNPALIPAEGSAATGRSYVLRDAPGRGTWHYRLEDVGAGGKRTPHPAGTARVGPDAAGRELFVPRAEATRADRPRAAVAGGATDGQIEAAGEAQAGWLARWWRRLME